VLGQQITVELATVATRPRSGGRDTRQVGANVALNDKITRCDKVSDVLALFADDGAAFDPVNLTTSLHKVGQLNRTFGTAHFEPLQLLAERCSASLLSDPAAWEPRLLSSAVWGVAKLGAGVRCPALFDAVAVESSKKVGRFKPQELALAVWAFAKQAHAAPGLFQNAADEAGSRISEFKAQELANTAWAFARAGFPAPALFDAIAAESVEKISTFSPQELANVVWAFQEAGIQSPFLFDQAAEQTVKKIRLYKAQELANTALVYAKAHRASPVLFQEIATESVRQVQFMNSQALANIVWAFAKAGVSAPDLFQAVANESNRKMTTFNAQALVNMTYAFASARIEAPALFAAVRASVCAEMGRLRKISASRRCQRVEGALCVSSSHQSLRIVAADDGLKDLQVTRDRASEGGPLRLGSPCSDPRA
jgi:hypothetical protein